MDQPNNTPMTFLQASLTTGMGGSVGLGAVQRRSRFSGFSTLVGTLKDSVMVVFLVVVAALALSAVEGMIGRDDAATPVYAKEEALVPWINTVLGIPTAYAAPLKGFEALAVTAPSSITLAPGETKALTYTFKNIGTTTWVNSGEGFVSIYTHGPKYRSSVFQADSWYGATQPSRLKESSVKPGAVGTVTLTLTAPKTAGTYTEVFQLASEDTAWIPGGSISLTVTVSGSSSSASTTSTSVSLSGTVTTSPQAITAKGGISVLYTVSVKNTGKTAWGTRQLKPSQVSIATDSTTDVQHKSWKSAGVVMESTTTIKPGATDTFTFAFSSPKEKGSYDLVFQLVADGQTIAGTEIEIPVTVTANAPDVKNRSRKKSESPSTSTTKKSEDGIVQNIQIEDPTMRVGVLIVDEETDDQVVISADGGMTVEDTSGKVLLTVTDDDEVTAYYKNGKYYYDDGSGKQKVSTPIRFVPTTKNAILTVTNFDRTKTRNSAYSDNQFRNVLEIRYNNVKDRTWLINELSMEMYLRGLAETSNISPLEFQKALIVAARTYGYYHWQRNTKHDDEGFTVDAYLDQVYKGYGQEARTPNLTKAIEETRGVTVTYDGSTAITPYFSRSGGKTYDWSEVWGGEVAWCKSVPVPWDKGKVLWGHGVGMSASGALAMANEGKTYQEILKYFYTGIDLEKRWK